MRRRILSIAGVLSLIAASGCGGGDQDGEDGGLQEVTAGVIAIVDVAPIYLGDQQGFFEERGIDLNLEVGSGGAASIPGVVSGDLDFAFGNVVSLIIAREQGLPLQIISNGVATTGEQGADFSAVVVKEDSPIESAADLEGATVSANNLQNIGDTTVRASVRKDGGDPSQVEFVEMGLPDMSAAVEKEEIDAAWVVEPFVSMALEDGHREIASNFADGHPELTVATYFTSEEVIAQDPELVDRLTAALEESLAYAAENPDEVREIMGTYTEMDEDLAGEVRLPAWPEEVNRESVETMAELMHQDGLIDEIPDLNELYR
ncbi:ABC transporter substrate-binding protein [Allosalinactinospora lopnorensis]|uniref:ABC transporter substrate-binding protein n=1 Tax=Allosalinactinospora lopnorensis TaxID=1352348 RepID=UPI000623EC02|nr:ABC transporter substrate-binding protein [Allosalinactinospora lopnorensis]